MIINQVGWAGINLGRIDVEFGYQQKPKMVEGTAINIVDNLWKTPEMLGDSETQDIVFAVFWF